MKSLRTDNDVGYSKAHERLEGLYTAHRLFELRRDPVRGNFNAAHLREINRRIFQDLLRFGFTEVTPGQYREPVQVGKDWIKARSLEDRAVTSFVAYSPMDKNARDAIDRALESIDPAALGKLKTAAFTKAIAELYTKLDYLHPFPDGNSRTLRTFNRSSPRQPVMNSIGRALADPKEDETSSMWHAT